MSIFTKGIRPLLLLAVVAIILVSVAMTWYRPAPKTVISDNDLIFKATLGEFISEITEPGDLDSSQNVIVKCKVKSRGRAGTAILEIVPEGTLVQKGQLIAQFDDSILRDEWTAQKIKVATDKAAKIQAESDLNTAKQVLDEFKNGTFEQEKSTIEAALAVAQENLERAREYLRYSDLLNAKGYVTDSQRDADRFAVEKADKELALATQKLDVYVKFTNSRLLEEYQAAIDKQTAYLEAAKFTLELSQQREKESAAEVENCKVTAPQAGMVVYANEGRRDNSSIVIEEGTMIRDGQEIVKLPDPTKMQVITQVNDSKINMVNEGDPAIVYLDSDPETPIKAVVREVSKFPLPRRWYQAPINYEVFVDILEVTSKVKPGLRAKVKVIVEQLDNVLKIPSSSVIRKDERFFVIVRRENDWEVKEVTLGANNDKFVVIKSGLAEGDPVIIGPEKYRDNSDIENEIDRLIAG